MNFVKYFFDAFVRDITVLGSIVFYAILMLAFAQTPVFYKLLSGVIVMYAINVPLKFVFFKSRPNRMKYKKFWEKIEASSFPSVHAERAAFLALVFIYAYQNVFLSSLAILLAILVCYSRIYLKKHYWRDIAAGIILGAAIFWFVGLL
ncbi:MAG: phosphatase PAP2 family protein [Candidatus Aenigmatarchaeota archaeon]